MKLTGDRSLGGARGGRPGLGGARGGAKVIIEPHRHEGVFIARGKEDLLVTKNLVPGESVYNEKRISVEVCATECRGRSFPSRLQLHHTVLVVDDL